MIQVVIDFLENIFLYENFIVWFPALFGLAVLFAFLKICFRLYRSNKIRGEVTDEFNSREETAEEDRAWVLDILLTAGFAQTRMFFHNIKTFEKTLRKYKRRRDSSDRYVKNLPELRRKLGFSLPNQDMVHTRQLYSDLNLGGYTQHQGDHLEFTSRVLVVYEDQFWVTPPKIEGESPELDRDSSATFIYIPERGQPCKFVCPVIQQVRMPVPALVMGHADYVEYLTIRMSQRKKVDLPISIRIPKKPEPGEIAHDGEDDLLEGAARDLSREGMLFRTSQLLPDAVQGDIVSTIIPIGPRAELIFECEIMLSNFFDYGRRYLHIRFIRLTKGKEEEFTAYLDKLKSAEANP